MSFTTAKPQIAITCDEPRLQHAAQHLATQIALPYIERSSWPHYDFVLVLSDQGLVLQAIQVKGLGCLKVEFLRGAMGYRLQHLREQKQLLVKAIGSNTHTQIRVLDLTAGLGRDGFILATLAYSVTLLERSSVIAALLHDGLQRAVGHERYAHLDLRLISVDSLCYLHQLTQVQEFPDVIYLDPMYPHSKNSALVKKEMRLLRHIVGDDPDAEQLLPLAIRRARQRVVVKRPCSARCLADLTPQYSIRGRRHRFDVYVTHGKRVAEAAENTHVIRACTDLDRLADTTCP